MHSIWQQFTLSQIQVRQWRGSSYVYHLVGLLRSWRKTSWLLPWGEAIGALLVAVTLGLAPFVSTTLIGILGVAIALWWVILTLADEPEATPAGVSSATPIHLALLLYWFISLFATALSPVKMAALVGLSRLTLYLMTFLLMARVMRSSRLRNAIISVYLHTSLIVSVYGIQQWQSGVKPLATWTDANSPLKDVTRVYSYLGNPNLLAAYLVPAIALSLGAIFAWKGWMPKLLAATIFVVNSTCLFYTYSRGGWLGFAVCIFTFAILLGFWYSDKLPSPWRKLAIPVILGGTGFLFLAAVLGVPSLRDRFLSMFMGRQDSSNNFRLNVWSSVINMIQDRPVLGIGPGNSAFNAVYPLYQRTRFTALSAYSILLEIAVETGFIGLSCFLWFLVITWNQAAQRLSQFRSSLNSNGFWLMGAIAGTTGMLAHGLVDTVWYRPQVILLWWLLVAIITSYYLWTPTPKENPETAELVNN